MAGPREIKLPSGATLKVTPAPFGDAKALYQALLREMKAIEIGPQSNMQDMFKSAFCIGLSSPEIERCLWDCMKRCTYNGGAGDLKIDAETFEPVERRDDYIKVCVEVGRENVIPFANSLYAEYLFARTAAEKNIRQ